MSRKQSLLEWYMGLSPSGKFFVLGVTANAMGEEIEALKHLTRAITIDNHRGARGLRAMIWAGLGMMPLAEMDWERIRRDEPSLPPFAEIWEHHCRLIGQED